VLPHHDQQASSDQNQTEHGQMFSSNMLLLILIPLIGVTFSTPTGFIANHQRPGSSMGLIFPSLTQECPQMPDPLRTQLNAWNGS